MPAIGPLGRQCDTHSADRPRRGKTRQNIRRRGAHDTSWSRGTATACADVHDSRGGLGYRYGSDRRGGRLHALAAATIDGQERLACSNRRACASCGRDLLISAQQENARRQKRSIRSKPWVRVQNRYTAFADFSVPGASRSRRVRRLDDAKASRQNGRARQGVPACQSGYPY